MHGKGTLPLKNLHVEYKTMNALVTTVKEA